MPVIQCSACGLERQYKRSFGHNHVVKMAPCKRCIRQAENKARDKYQAKIKKTRSAIAEIGKLIANLKSD